MKHIYKDSLKLNYYKDESKIYKYDNKDYYGVDYIRHTPDNYFEEMGVPISFIEHINFDQFEIIDKLNVPLINNEYTYKRLIIKRKQ